MVAPQRPANCDVQKRLSALKFRISAKKIEADELFSDIFGGEKSRLKNQLESIRSILQNQQNKQV